MRVVFMGTPDIAATCLKRILADGFEVVGVYTQPDRPKGRGMKLTASPTKQVALEAGIPVFQPESFREEETVEQLRALRPDLCAVVAYGRILPQKVLDVPTFGCINIHASVLPAYRGSAPYQWAVLDGLKETGVTAMYLVREMDAGDIIDVSKTPIGENETAGELLDRLAALGAELLSKTLTRFTREKCQPKSRTRPRSATPPCWKRACAPSTGQRQPSRFTTMSGACSPGLWQLWSFTENNSRSTRPALYPAAASPVKFWA